MRVSTAVFRLSAAAGALLCVAFTAILKTGVLGDRGTVIADDYLCWIVPALAGAACLARSRAGLARGRGQRLGWSLMAASCLLWGTGGVIWTGYEVHLGRELPYPSPADAGYLLSVPAAIAALILLSGVGGTAGSSAGSGWTLGARDVADGAIAGTALLFTSWATVLGPVFHASAQGPWTRAISLAYPTFDVLTATMALLAVAKARGRHRTTMTLLGLGLASVAVSDSSFAWFTSQDNYLTGNLFDTGYVAGYLLIALAAMDPVSTPASAQTVGSDGLPGRLALTLPYLPLLAVGVVSLTIDLAHRPLGAFLYWDGAVLLALVLGRQLLSLYANQALSRRLEQTVTTLRRRESELAHQAFHDDLTGLPNRAAFNRQLSEALQEPGRPPVTVMIIDLDGFKAVNDTHGHHVGDRLLAIAARRLRSCVRDIDTVARVGGDEFAVILHGSSTPRHTQDVAGRIRERLADPAHIGATTVAAGASIGTATSQDTTDLDDLLRRADLAMYEAKRNSRSAAGTLQR